jgi:hypothetical protein
MTSRLIPTVLGLAILGIGAACGNSNGGPGPSGASGQSTSGGSTSGGGTTSSGSSSGGVGSTGSSSGNGSSSGGGSVSGSSSSGSTGSSSGAGSGSGGGSMSGSTSGGSSSGSASSSDGGSSGGSSGSSSDGGSSSGSACTSPTWSSSEATGTESLDSAGTWWVNNDAWSGSHGPQTINVCSHSSWNAVSNQTDEQGQVETYPDTEYDVGGRNNGSPTKTIAQYSSITSTFAEAFPSAGSWDAAYDLWLNDWGTEIMIWNEWTGTQLYWPPSGSQAVTLDGVAYHFYNNGGELMFFRDAMVKSGSVDILAAMKWLVSQSLVKSTDVPTQLEYGVEICSTSGSETFPMTGLTFDLN